MYVHRMRLSLHQPKQTIDSDTSAHHHPLGYLSLFMPIQAINLKCQLQLATHSSDAYAPKCWNVLLLIFLDIY